jgi:hypothetical protein
MFNVKNDALTNWIWRVEMLLEILKMPPACAVCDSFPSHDGGFSEWISTLRIFQYVRSEHYHLLERFAVREVAGGG